MRAGMWRYFKQTSRTKRWCRETRKVNEWIETFYFSVFYEPNNQCFAKIEKILVNLLMETKKANLMDIGEYQKIFFNIICNYRINMAEMLDYTERRKIKEKMRTMCNGTKSTYATLS